MIHCIERDPGYFMWILAETRELVLVSGASAVAGHTCAHLRSTIAFVALWRGRVVAGRVLAARARRRPHRIVGERFAWSAAECMARASSAEARASAAAVD